jgi:lysophospholipase L1-like esterase
MSDQIERHQPERDREGQARAPHEASEQSDPELATPRTQHGRLGILVVGLPVFLLALGVMAVSATACGGATETSLATTLSGEGKEGETITVLEGSKVKDKATLSGTHASEATGKVKYAVYSESECKTLVKAAGEVTVSGTSVPASSEETLTGGAAYYWQAVYSGDSKNSGSTSKCGKEISTVKASTSLSTSLAGESKLGEEITVTEGAKVSDTATLSGTAASMATGTVKYDVYSDWECKELVTAAGEVSVSGEMAPASSEETLPVGTYYWQATYSGDGINESSTSACGSEVSVVTPAVTTSLSGEGQSGEGLEVVEGAAVSDLATLYGEHASIATGTVKYKVYSDSECKDLVTAAGEATVSGASVPKSSEETLSSGTYYWQAEYSGDAHNPAATSACGSEIVMVQTATSLTTLLSGEAHSGEEITVQEGAAVSDKAMLSGTNASTAEGYVKYDVYSDSECKDLAAVAGDVSVTGGSVPASSEETLPVGTYYWQATYSGDGANHSSTSTCGSETSTVTAPVTTSLLGEEQSGSEVEVEETAAVSDLATLHSEHASIATGTVKYEVYSDSECKDLVTAAGEVSVSGASVPKSSEETLPEGDYYWQADYSGDANNPAAKSACGTEVAVVKGPNAQYAALGDSFSSGLGAGAYYTTTNRTVEANYNICFRSIKAYPARVAEALYPGKPVTEEKEVLKQQPRFIFRACNGAVTENIWGTVGGAGGQYNEWVEGTPGRWLTTPAQDLWLSLPGGEPLTGPNQAITLVTLTIGGNDAGFSLIGAACVNSTDVFFNLASGYSKAKCKEAIQEWETGEAKASGHEPKIPSGEEGIPSLVWKLPVVLSAIHQSAPNARIRVPLYPQILNTARNEKKILVGTFALGRSSIRLFIDNTPPRANDVAASLGRFIDKLNLTISATVQEWAREEKVDAKVIPGTMTAFAGHQFGDAEPWVNEVSGALDTDPRISRESIHPNCTGQKALAERVLRSLGRVPPAMTC